MTADRIARPAQGYRVSRCRSCDEAFTWKGSARPGCPRCGAQMGTTTRMLRAGFTLLEGDALALAERYPGGLQADITWEADHAASIDRRLEGAKAALAAGDATQDEDGVIRTDRWVWHPERMLAEAARHRAKADRYARRLAKLGGPTEVTR